MNDRPTTGLDIELKFHEQSVRLDEAYDMLEEGELEYQITRHGLERARAYAYVDIDKTAKIPVAEKEAMVTIACDEQILAHYIAAAKASSAKRNFERWKIQIDITRSQGALIRSSMDMA